MWSSRKNGTSTSTRCFMASRFSAILCDDLLPKHGIWSKVVDFPANLKPEYVALNDRHLTYWHSYCLSQSLFIEHSHHPSTRVLQVPLHFCFRPITFVQLERRCQASVPERNDIMIPFHIALYPDPNPRHVDPQRF